MNSNAICAAERDVGVGQHSPCCSSVRVGRLSRHEAIQFSRHAGASVCTVAALVTWLYRAAPQAEGSKPTGGAVSASPASTEGILISYQLPYCRMKKSLSEVHVLEFIMKCRNLPLPRLGPAAHELELHQRLPCPCMMRRRRSLSLSGDRAAAADDADDVEEADGDDGTRCCCCSWTRVAGDAPAPATTFGRDEDGLWVFCGGVEAGSLEWASISAVSRARMASMADE